MHTVSRVRRGMSAAVVSLALAATVLAPIGGVATAAAASSACFASEGPASLRPCHHSAGHGDDLSDLRCPGRHHQQF